MEYYSVRSVISIEPGLYEERITGWPADDIDAAIDLAAAESKDYAQALGDEAMPLLLFQAYLIEANESFPAGIEIFSLLRYSTLNPEDYLTTFFDTGSEVAESRDE